MDRSLLESTIAALDAAVPKDSARLVIRQYGGGPDECVVVANERGYQRLGIELLKASLAPAGYKDQPDAIEVDVDYLLGDESEVQLGWFERREPEAPPPVRAGWRDLAAMAMGAFLVGMFVLGCITAFQWVGAVVS